MLRSSVISSNHPHPVRPVGSAGNIGLAALASGLQAACSPRTFCFKARTPVLLSTLVCMQQSTFVHGRKSALRGCRPPCSCRCRVAFRASSS